MKELCLNIDLYCIGEVGVKSEGAVVKNQNHCGWLIFLFISYCYGSIVINHLE